MRYFILILILILTGIYLNRAYAYFYNFLGSNVLPKMTRETYNLGQAGRTYKIVSLGDSLSAGVGADSDKYSYPYLIGQKLGEGGLNVILYNYAEPGAETKDLLNSQLVPAIGKNPDLITILIGINDLHNWVSESQFQQNYQKIIDELKGKTTAKILLINIPYLGSGKILFFPYNFLLTLRTNSYNRIIKTLADENNLTYIDLYSGSRSKFANDESLYSRDHFHPSDKGYILWEEIIDANLNP